MHSKIKILFVEDSDMVTMVNKRALLYIRGAGNIDCLEAKTLASAEAAFSQHGNEFNIIVMDGNLSKSDDDLETVPFVERIVASGFKGIIIANSDRPKVNEALIKAGCSGKYCHPPGEVLKHTCHQLVQKFIESELL